MIPRYSRSPTPDGIRLPAPRQPTSSSQCLSPTPQWEVSQELCSATSCHGTESGLTTIPTFAKGKMFRTRLIRYIALVAILKIVRYPKSIDLADVYDAGATPFDTSFTKTKRSQLSEYRGSPQPPSPACLTWESDPTRKYKFARLLPRD